MEICLLPLILIVVGLAGNDARNALRGHKDQGDEFGNDAHRGHQDYGDEFGNDNRYADRGQEDQGDELGPHIHREPSVEPSVEPRSRVFGDLVETSYVCIPDVSRCEDDNAQCRHRLDLTSRFYCLCKPGFVTLPVQMADYHKKIFSCVPELSRMMDPSGCGHCIDNGGRCYDTDNDKKADGCVCPITRSTKQNHCDTLHFEVSCDKHTMTITYKPKGISEHQDIHKDLDAGYTHLYIRDHEKYFSCRFVKINNRYELTLSLDRNTCGLTTVNTTRMLSYTSYAMLRKTSSSSSYGDLCVEAYCRFDKLRLTHSGLVEILERKSLASEGVHAKPEISMTIRDARNEDVTFHVINMEEQIKMRIKYTDNVNVYTSLRAEVCVASDMLSLKHPDASSMLLLLHGCSPNQGPFSSSLMFHRKKSLTVIESSFFPAPKLGDSDNLFLHCAVRVCIDADECHPYDCSRKRRSLLSPAAEALLSLTGPEFTRKVIMINFRKLSERSIQPEDNRLELEAMGVSDHVEEVGRPDMIKIMLMGVTATVVCLVLAIVSITCAVFYKRRSGTKALV